MAKLVVALFAIAAFTSVNADGDEYLKDICNTLSRAVDILNIQKIVPTHVKAKFNTGGLLFHKSMSEEKCTDKTESFIETNPIPTVDAAHDSKLSQTTVKIKLAFKVRSSDGRFVLTARQSREATCSVTATPSGSIDLNDICNEDGPNWKTFMKPIEAMLGSIFINSKVHPPTPEDQIETNDRLSKKGLIN